MRASYEPLLDGLQRGRVDAARASAAGVASSRRTCGAAVSPVQLDVLRDVRRHDLAAVGDHRVEARHLDAASPRGRPGRSPAGPRSRASRSGRRSPCRAGRRSAGSASRASGTSPAFGADVDARAAAEAEPVRPELKRRAAARREVVEAGADRRSRCRTTRPAPRSAPSTGRRTGPSCGTSARRT